MPTPPGTIRTSSSGALAKVCVGRTDAANVEFMRLRAGLIGPLDTGSKVSAIRVRLE